MSLADNDYCYIHHDDHDAQLAEFDQNSPPPPKADFKVNIYTILTHVPFSVLEAEEVPGMLSDDYEYQTFHKVFHTQSDLLIGQDGASCDSNIAAMLSEVNVPEYAHENCIREISQGAQRIAAAAAAKLQNACDSTLTMSVHVGVVVVEEPEDFEEIDDRI